MKDEAGVRTRLTAFKRVKPINADPTPTTHQHQSQLRYKSHVPVASKCFIAFQHQDWIVNVIKYLHANPAAMSLYAFVQHARESLCSIYSEFKNI